MKVADHEPHSKEIDGHGGAKCRLESFSKFDPSIVGTLVEAIGKWDLFIVVSWQQANLVPGNAGRETKFRLELLGPVFEWESLPCGEVRPRHVRYKRHERILIRNHEFKLHRWRYLILARGFSLSRSEERNAHVPKRQILSPAR